MMEYAGFSLSLQSNMDKMRTIFAFMVPLLLLSACGGGRGNEQLARVDLLVIAVVLPAMHFLSLLRDISAEDGEACQDKAYRHSLGLLLELSYIL